MNQFNGNDQLSNSNEHFEDAENAASFFNTNDLMSSLPESPPSESSYTTAAPISDGDHDEFRVLSDDQQIGTQMPVAGTESTNQQELRAQIQAIMNDESNTDAEKRRLIQIAMDGRLRSGSIENNDLASTGETSSSVLDQKLPPTSDETKSTTHNRECSDDYEPSIVVGGIKYPMPGECTHYNRGNWIISQCCGLIFGCRICHDEYWQKIESTAAVRAATASSSSSNYSEICYDARSNSEGNNSNLENMTPHVIDRFGIKEIICKKCNFRQNSATNTCVHCSETFAEYHCKICNLWMEATKEPFHCEGCGFCRVGGRNNFIHCDTCCMCIGASIFSTHNCMGDKYKTDCPVCREDLFSSRFAPFDLPCGHVIHHKCFVKMVQFDDRCLLCRKSVGSPEDMAPIWEAMEMDIDLQPMPVNMSRIVTVICNDCSARSTNRPWHVLGVQCSSCSSFNTVVAETTLTGEAAFNAIQEISQARRNTAAVDDVPGLNEQNVRASFSWTRGSNIAVDNSSIASEDSSEVSDEGHDNE
mmetsp:Transcript_3409/g.6305  ORF Transcript_3409/g.6305 Transcript_3409/m.6305 type:complete len:530 (-) Transcript_3409:302-1891(-)